MANPFDQFDDVKPNPFDQFDAIETPPPAEDQSVFRQVAD
jgi:hypothetical protein